MKIPFKTISLLIVFIIAISLINLVAGAELTQLEDKLKDSRYFISGDVYDIFNPQFEYTKKNGVICYDVTKKVDSRGLINKLFDYQEDDNFKLVGLKDSVIETKYIEPETTETICYNYNYKLGYFSKFDIVAGTDVLDPIINVSEVYNESCVSGGGVLSSAISTSTSSSDYNNYVTVIGYTTNGVLSTPVFVSTYTFFGTVSVKPNSVDTIAEFYYVNGTLAASVPFAVTGTTIGTYNWARTGSISTTDRIGSVNVRFKPDSSGFSATFSGVYLNTSCTPYFYDEYEFSTGFINSINTTANVGCAFADIEVSENGTTYQTMSSFNHQFTEPVNKYYLKIDQSSCNWVLLNSTSANENLSNSFNVNFYDVSTNNLITRNLKVELYNYDQSIYKSYYTSTGNYIFYFLEPENYTLTVSNDTYYYTGSFFNKISSGDHDTLNAYLIPINETSNVNVKVVSTYGNNQDGVLVSIKQYLYGNLVTISQKYTDSTGIATFGLKQGVKYIAYLDKEGYTTQTATITPTTNPYETTLIISPISQLNFDSNLQCIDFYNFTSINTNFDLNKLYNISLLTHSSISGIDYFGITASNFNTTYTSNITVFPSGSNVNLQVNFSSNVTAQYFIKCSGQDVYTNNVTYYIAYSNYTNTTIQENIKNAGQNASILLRVGVIVVVSLIFAVIMWELALPVAAYGIGVAFVIVFFTIPPISWINPVLATLFVLILIMGSIFVGGQNG